jgi:hypothetical protein
MTLFDGAREQNTLSRRCLRLIWRWAGILMLGSMAGLAPYVPPPPPPPPPRIEARAEDGDLAGDEDEP